MQLIVIRNALDSCSVITRMAQSDYLMRVNSSIVLQEVKNREMPEWAIRRETLPWNYVRTPIKSILLGPTLISLESQSILLAPQKAVQEILANCLRIKPSAWTSRVSAPGSQLLQLSSTPFI